DGRDPEQYIYPNKQWTTAFVGGDYTWLKDGGEGGRNHDARTLFFYYATVNTPAMVRKIVGAGSQYALVFRDSEGRFLEGSKTYKLRVDTSVPANDFWSVVVYDPQTRSELQTSQPFPSKNNQKGEFDTNPDGSVDIYFGPEAPEGKEANWIETIPGKGWFTAFRLYGPTEPWFDQTWQLNDIELIEGPEYQYSEPVETIEDGMLISSNYNTPIPAKILTPATVETRFGTLEFMDGYPTEKTTKLLYEGLDIMRGADTFLKGIPITSMEGIRLGYEEMGIDKPWKVMIFDKLMDSNPLFLTGNPLFLTGNTDTAYGMTMFDLEESGPIVVEIPTGMGPCTINDAYFRFVIDMGVPGPDAGEGGKYLILPPGYEGAIPSEFTPEYVAESPSYINWLVMRAFLVDGKTDDAVKKYSEELKIYPLSMQDNPPAMEIISGSEKYFNTIHANNFEFYEELNHVIQKEPIEFIDPETRGLFASIGIQKGKEFNPDARMRKMLDEGAAIGNGMARAIIFDAREEGSLIYGDERQWRTWFIGGDYEWIKDKGAGGRYFDARTLFFYAATVNTPAMAAKIVGKGSQYTYTGRDVNGEGLDGSKTYKLNVPAPVPAKDFWSVVVYDPQTRSQLQTSQPFPSKNNQKGEFKVNEDGSVDIYFGPEAPTGMERNWVETVPGKNWFTIFRLYGPLEPWFDKSWKLNDIEEVK
ncbi:MAG: DUF1214 domain-containing protein, partial [Promethearchaeota archaeon]